MERNNCYSSLTYDSLLPYDKNENLFALMRNISTGIIENKNYSDQIILIMELRRMRKYVRDLFTCTFNNIRVYFQNNIMKSSNSLVVYNSLILVSEIFSFYEFPECSDINKWISDLLSIVIKLSASTSDYQLQKQSFIALYHLANNMFYEETYECLFNLLISEESSISQNACETLLTFIFFIDSNLLIDDWDWKDQFPIILELANSFNEKYIERIKNILTSLCNKFGENTFKIFLGKYLNETQIINLLKLIKTDKFMKDVLKERINSENFGVDF